MQTSVPYLNRVDPIGEPHEIFGAYVL